MSRLLQGERLALVRGGRLLFEGSGPQARRRRCAPRHRPQRQRQVEPDPAGRRTAATERWADRTGRGGAGRRGPGARPRAAAGPRAGLLEGPASRRGHDRLSARSSWPHVPVRLLSTGQAKRARLARVMASGAPLWLLDEPLNGLDRDGAKRLAAAIAAHRAGRRRGARREPSAAGRRVAALELGR